ncbi:hypothetical protein ACN28S_05815 [Cystobacter fuscus]
MSIAASNVPWAMLNAAFLPAPVDTEAALRQAATAAARYFTPRGQGWMLALCEDWVPPALRARGVPVRAPGPHAQRGGHRHGRRAAAPPARPLPRMELRAASDARVRGDLADLNSLSYDVALATGRRCSMSRRCSPATTWASSATASSRPPAARP